MDYALIIGCNYSGTNYRLYGCINDCMLVQNMLINNYGYKSENIFFMRDDIYQASNSLYPSRNNIISALRVLIQRSNVSGCRSIYFHYSGHGSNVRDNSGDEKDGLDEFIVPRDFFTTNLGILDDEIYNILKNLNNNIPCLMVFDCCNSGTIVDLKYSYSLSAVGFAQNIENNDNSLDNKNIICLSACRDNEYALDINSNGQANGAMTLALITCLGQKKWTVNLNELTASIYQFLKANKYDTQRPLITSTKNIDLTKTLFMDRQTQIASNTNNSTTSPAASNTNNSTTPVAAVTNNNISVVEAILSNLVKTNMVSIQNLETIIQKLKN